MSQNPPDVLERAFPPPSDAFERLVRRRSRTARTRRVAAAVLALVIGAAGFEVVTEAFLRDVSKPAPSGPLTPANVSQLKLAWWFDTGASIDSSPVVAGDRVYITPASGALFVLPVSCGSPTGTCAPIWSTTGSRTKLTVSPSWGSAAVGDGRVYVGGFDGKLLGYPTSCGAGRVCRPIWLAKTGGSLTPGSPVVAGGIVYIGSDDGTLSAFPETCTAFPTPCPPLWQASLDGGFGGGTPVVANGVVYVGSSGGTLYAFPTSCGRSTTTCAPLWRAETPGVRSAPLGRVIAPLVAGDGVVYMASGSDLYAFPASCSAPGKLCPPRWVGHTETPIGSATLGDGYVAVVSFGGIVSVFPESCGTGGAPCAPLWITSSRHESYANPIVENGILYAGFERGVEAFRAGCWSAGGSCSPLWTSSETGTIVTTPVIANGTLFATSQDGRVYAFNLNGGAPALPPPRQGSRAVGRPGPKWGYAALYLGVLALVVGVYWGSRRRKRGEPARAAANGRASGRRWADGNRTG